MPWHYSSIKHALNPEGAKVEGEITVYRIVPSDPPTAAAFRTDFTRDLEKLKQKRLPDWPRGNL